MLKVINNDKHELLLSVKRTRELFKAILMCWSIAIIAWVLFTYPQAKAYVMDTLQHLQRGGSLNARVMTIVIIGIALIIHTINTLATIERAILGHSYRFDNKKSEIYFGKRRLYSYFDIQSFEISEAKKEHAIRYSLILRLLNGKSRAIEHSYDKDAIEELAEHISNAIRIKISRKKSLN